MYEKCQKHPRYKGKGQPTSTCCQCWSLWMLDCMPSKAVLVLRKFKGIVIREATRR